MFCSLETVNNTFEFPMMFLNLYTKISIEFWIRNTLLQKLPQTDMIFFDQLKVPAIKFGKCFADFMIQIAFLKEFGS